MPKNLGRYWGQSPIFFDPTGNYLAAGSSDGEVSVWNAQSCQLVDSFRLSFSSALEEFEGWDAEWDFQSRRPDSGLQKRLESAVHSLWSLDLSARDGLIACVGGDNVVVLRKFLEHKEQVRFRVPVLRYGVSSFSEMREGSSAILNNARRAKERSGRTVPESSIRPSGDSPDDSSLLRYIQNPLGVRSIHIAPDGSVLTVDMYGLMRRWDASTGKPQMRYGNQYRVNGSWGISGGMPEAERLAFVARTSRIIQRSDQRDALVEWDLSTGGKRDRPGIPSGGWEIRLDSEERTAAVSTALRTDIYDIQSWRLLVSLYVYNFGKDWLAVTPEGFFDGSPDAYRETAWRFSNNAKDYASVDAYFSEYYRPGIVQELISGRKLPGQPLLAERDRRSPQVEIRQVESAGGSQRSIKLRITVQEAPKGTSHQTNGGIRDVRLFRNGTLVSLWRGDLLQGRGNSVTITADMPTVLGENRFIAYAFNRDNIKSEEAQLSVSVSEPLPRRRTAYIVAVGINQYGTPELNLRYATSDAKLFSEVVARQQKQSGQFDEVIIVNLLDQEATRENIIEALRRFDRSSTVSRGPSTPESFGRLRTIEPQDSLFLYFAGHGIARNGKAYLAAHDSFMRNGEGKELTGSEFSRFEGNSITTDDLSKLLGPIDATRIVLVVDACNSGEFLESLEQRQGPFNTASFAQLAYEKGMFILTAAQGYQAALESSRLGHGFLTHALIQEALIENKADSFPADGRITIQEWFNYATTRVPEMQRERFVAVGAGAHGSANLPDFEPWELQTPRAFLRRDADEVALSTIAGPSNPAEADPKPPQLIRKQ
ncbi:MAG: caspase family protein [Fimbriimonadaceae bacterium]|nr:caspase family protein [Fimbriimonadaceae bacterium]